MFDQKEFDYLFHVVHVVSSFAPSFLFSSNVIRHILDSSRILAKCLVHLASQIPVLRASDVSLTRPAVFVFSQMGCPRIKKHLST